MIREWLFGDNKTEGGLESKGDFEEEVLIQGRNIISLRATEDVSKHELVCVFDDNQCRPTTDVERAYGVVCYDACVGEHVAVASFGCVVQVESRESIHEGWVRPITSLKWVNCDKENAFGYALTSCYSGELFEMDIVRPGEERP